MQTHKPSGYRIVARSASCLRRDVMDVVASAITILADAPSAACEDVPGGITPLVPAH
jgi:hypothetical protein